MISVQTVTLVCTPTIFLAWQYANLLLEYASEILGNGDSSSTVKKICGGGGMWVSRFKFMS